MIVDAISLDAGGFPSAELHLVSSEGLAPLQLPQSLPQPSYEAAVRRFQAAMDGDGGDVLCEDGIAERRGTGSQSEFRGGLLQTESAGEEKSGGGLFDAFPALRETHEAPTLQAHPETLIHPEPLAVRQAGTPANPSSLAKEGALSRSAPLREMKTGAADSSATPVAERAASRRDAGAQREIGGEVFPAEPRVLAGLEVAGAGSADASRTLPIPQTAIEAPSVPATAPAGPETPVIPGTLAHTETPAARQSEDPVNLASLGKEGTLRNPGWPGETKTGVADASAAPVVEGAVISRAVISRRDAGTRREIGGEVFQIESRVLAGLEVPEAGSADASRTSPIPQATIEAPPALAAAPANPSTLADPGVAVSQEARAYREIPARTETPVVPQTEGPVNRAGPVKEGTISVSGPLHDKDKDAVPAVDVVEKTVSASAHVVLSPSAIEPSAPQNIAAAPQPEAAASRTDAIVETVNKIVESVTAEISVTPSVVKGEEMVHITLKPAFLDGSEITLSAKDGTLTVAIAPATPQAGQAVSIALPRLETALAEHIPAFQQFAVVLKKGKSNETA